MRRHYSTWDIFAAVYWPRTQWLELILMAARMRLSQPARSAARMLAFAAKRADRNIWTRTLHASWMVIVAVALLVVLANSGRIGARLVSTFGLLVLLVGHWLIIKDKARVNAAAYFACRRMREHLLVRQAPNEIASLATDLRPRELETRRDEAAMLLSALPPLRNLAAHAFDGTMLRLLTLIMLPVFVTAQIAAVWSNGTSFATVWMRVVLFFAAVWLLAMIASLISLKHRIRRALRHSACPDCGYPLAEIPPTPSPLQPTLNLGPKRCPECGSPWPLIPLTLDSRPLAPTFLPPAPSTPSPQPPANPHTSSSS